MQYSLIPKLSPKLGMRLTIGEFLNVYTYILQGKVPRNEYGNVEMFQPSMLPPGACHLRSKLII